MCLSFAENSPDILPSAPVKQNIEIVKQPVPVYIPTPKHLLEARKVNGSTKYDECSASKRPKLEYVPKALSNNSAPIPTYVPSSVANTVTDEYEPRNVCGNNADVLNCDVEADSNGDDILGLLNELSTEQMTNNSNQSNCMTINSKPSTDTIDLDETKEQKSKENSHKSSSSSRHRHHSHKSSHSERKSSNTSSRSSSSTHKSSHHSSHKSRHADKAKDKHLDKNKDKAKSRHSSKSSKDIKHKSNEHRSKSTSSRHHSSHHSDKKTHSSNNNSSNQSKDCVNNSIEYETESEDDDVEAQCRMIFEEFVPSTIENKTDETSNGLSMSTEEDANDITAKIDDATRKKRVAHENADKQIKSIASFRRQGDHVKNAMQVC